MPFDDEEDADMKLFFVCSFVLYFRFLNEKKKKKNTSYESITSGKVNRFRINATTF